MNKIITQIIDKRESKVNKSQLIDDISKSTGMPKSTAIKALDAILDSITKKLQSGEDIILVGFGSFSIANRSARIGRNPQTGGKIEIAATKKPVFKAGKGLRDAVNQT